MTTVDSGASTTRVSRHVVVDDVVGQCHASTVATVPDGFLVAWFQGDHEGASNCSIWLARGSDSTWSSPRRVSGELGPCWNPVLHRRQDGRLLLFFKVGPTISEWATYRVESSDDGTTWSSPVELVPGDRGGRGPVRTSPLRLRSGRLLAGASTEEWGERPRWNAFVDASDDDGLTWTRGADLVVDRSELGGAGVIQPTLWQSADGTVRLLARSTSGHLVGATSNDEGVTWSSGARSVVPNNNSGVSACSAGDRVFLAHNPVSGDWAPRAPLTVSVSSDDGASWRRLVDLEESRTADGAGDGTSYLGADTGVVTTGANEFSYPSLIPVPDGLAVSYTWQRRGIRLALIDHPNRSSS